MKIVSKQSTSYLQISKVTFCFLIISTIPASIMHRVTYKSGGVVILDSFGIAESLKDGIGLKQLSFKFSLLKSKINIIFTILLITTLSNSYIKIITKE